MIHTKLIKGKQFQQINRLVLPAIDFRKTMGQTNFTTYNPDCFTSLVLVGYIIIRFGIIIISLSYSLS